MAKILEMQLPAESTSRMIDCVSKQKPWCFSYLRADTQGGRGPGAKGQAAAGQCKSPD